MVFVAGSNAKYVNYGNLTSHHCNDCVDNAINLYGKPETTKHVKKSYTNINNLLTQRRTNFEIPKINDHMRVLRSHIGYLSAPNTGTTSVRIRQKGTNKKEYD